MPSFDLEFEVFCGTCGAGLCNQSDSRKSRRRGEAQVTVEVCQTCIEKAEAPLCVLCITSMVWDGGHRTPNQLETFPAVASIHLLAS